MGRVKWNLAADDPYMRRCVDSNNHAVAAKFVDMDNHVVAYPNRFMAFSGKHKHLIPFEIEKTKQWSEAGSNGLGAQRDLVELDDVPVFHAARLQRPITSILPQFVRLVLGRRVTPEVNDDHRGDG